MSGKFYNKTAAIRKTYLQLPDYVRRNLSIADVQFVLESQDIFYEKTSFLVNGSQSGSLQTFIRKRAETFGYQLKYDEIVAILDAEDAYLKSIGVRE